MAFTVDSRLAVTPKPKRRQVLSEAPSLTLKGKENVPITSDDCRLAVTPKPRQVSSEALKRLTGSENRLPSVPTPTSEKLFPVDKNDILKDVVAYVEVRSVNEDRSEAVAYYLDLLGATISKYMNRKVTHVVFRNGRRSTYNKAVEFGVHMVTVLWVEECRQKACVVNEKDYAAEIPEEFTSPFFIGKIKRFRPMIPKVKEFEISVSESLKRRERYRIKREYRELLKCPKSNLIIKFDEKFPSLLTKSTGENQLKNEEIDETEKPTKRLKLDKTPTGTINLEADEIPTKRERWEMPLLERILTPISKSPIEDNETDERTARGRKLFSQPVEVLEFTPQRRSSRNIFAVTQSLSERNSTDSCSVRIRSRNSLASLVKVKCESRVEDVFKSSKSERSGNLKENRRSINRKRLLVKFD